LPKLAISHFNGELLSGLKSYKLHLPDAPLTWIFWEVTPYDITDGRMTAALKLMPSIHDMNDVVENANGLADH
jgi:hypothetical protein